MNIKERLEQCKNDISKLEEEKVRLERRLKEIPEFKFGDIVEYSFERYRRILLYDEKGKLCPFGLKYKQNGPLSSYEKTGKNIFKDNLLDLDI